VINPYSTQTYQRQNKVEVTDGLLRKEISGNRSSIFSNITFYKYNPDTLVGKKGLEVYRKMKEDDQVKACLTIKKFARMSTTWDVKPGDENSPQSVEIADFVRYCFRKLKGTFEKHLVEILSAFDYGFSITEKVFDIYRDGPFKGKVGLVKLANREPFGYTFKTDDHNNIIGICFDQAGLANDSSELGSYTNPYPPDKFVIYSYNSEHGNPYGVSDLRAAYRGWWSKDLNIKWWNIFNERFGMPTAIAKYPAKGKGLSKAAIDEIDDVLKNLQAKSGVRIPDNITLELLEAQRRGESTYGEAIDKYDLMIARSILVPSLLGFNAREATGSYALGKSHFDVFMFVLEMIGRDIEETIVSEQIIKPLIQLNYGDVPEEIEPNFEFESLIDEDTEARSRVVKMLADANLIDKREDWVRDYLSLPERDLNKYPYATPVGEVSSTPTSPPISAGGNFPTSPTPSNPPKETPGKGNKEIPDKGIDKVNDKEEMQLNRPITKFEKKVDFKGMDAELNLLTDGLKIALTPILESWKKDLLKKAEKLLYEKNLTDVNKLQIRGVGEFKNTLRDYLIKTYLDSKLHALEEIQEVGFPVEVKRKFGLLSMSNFALEPWDPIPPKEALDFYNRKVIAVIKKEGQPKKLMAIGKMQEISYYDKRAFTITGIENEYILNQAKLAIEKGIRDGLLKDTMNSLKDLFSKYLETGEIKDGKLVTPSRLETIARTNITEALNEGRMTMYKDPDVDDFVPYLQWSSIMDTRTTEYCRSMDGKIFKKGEVLLPPAHFNCRSTVVPVTTIEVEEAGGVVVDNWQKENSKVGRPQGFKKEEM